MSSGNSNGEQLQLFTLNSNRALAEEIANHIGIPLGKCTVTKFSDGETQINIEESVRGCAVYIIQSTSEPVNENLMELLILIRSEERRVGKVGGARRWAGRGASGAR